MRLYSTKYLLFCQVILFVLLLSPLTAQTNFWKTVKNRLVPLTPSYGLDLRSGYYTTTGLRLGYSTQADSGVLRYDNGLVSYWNGSAWLTIATSSGGSVGDADSLGGNPASYYAVKADSTIVAVNAPLTLSRANHTTTLSIDTTNIVTGLVTRDMRRRDSLYATTKLNIADSAKSAVGYGLLSTQVNHLFTSSLDTSIAVNKAGTQVISGAKWFTSEMNGTSAKFSSTVSADSFRVLLTRGGYGGQINFGNENEGADNPNAPFIQGSSYLGQRGLLLGHSGIVYLDIEPNGDVVTGSDLTVTGNATIAGYVVPDASSTYDLGRYNFIWDSAYVNYLKGTSATLSGNLNVASVIPHLNNTYNLGGSANAWDTLFTQDANVYGAFTNLGSALFSGTMNLTKTDNSATRFQATNTNSGGSTIAGYLGTTDDATFGLQGFSSGFGSGLTSLTLLQTDAPNGLRLNTNASAPIKIYTNSILSATFGTDQSVTVSGNLNADSLHTSKGASVGGGVSIGGNLTVSSYGTNYISGGTYNYGDITIVKDIPTISLYGTQSGGRQYGLLSGIVGISNTGFSIRDITNSSNLFSIDVSNNATLIGALISDSLHTVKGASIANNLTVGGTLTTTGAINGNTTLASNQTPTWAGLVLNGDYHQVSTGGHYWGNSGTYTLGINGSTTANKINFITNSATIGYFDATSLTLNGALSMGTNAIASVGAITSTGLSSFDSLKVNGKLKFQSNTSASVGVTPMQLFADTTVQNALFYDAYLVRRTVDLTHNILPDSFRVTGTTRTIADTLVMGKKFPRSGKMVETRYTGQYNLAVGKKMRITFWKGGITEATGTKIDSISYTSAGGATNEAFTLTNEITYRTSGTSGRFHSFTELRVNGQSNIMDSNVGTIDTDTAQNLIYIVINLDDAGSWVQFDTGRTATRN